MFHLKSDWPFKKSWFGKRTHRTPVRNPLTRRLGVEHLEVFDHVGLLANEPLGTAGLLSI